MSGLLMSRDSRNVREASSLWDRSWMARVVHRISTRGALVERRRWNFVVDREPSSFNSWTGLSRVIGMSSRSRTALPPAEALLEREAALPESSQSAPRSAPVSKVDGCLGSMTNLFVTCSDGQFLSLRTMSSWVTWVLTPGLMGLEFVLHKSRTTKLSSGVNVGFTQTKRSPAAKEIPTTVVTGQHLCGVSRIE